MSCCVLVVSGYSVVCSFSSSFCAGSQATTFTDGRFIITIEWSNKSETLWNVAHCSCFLIQSTHTQHWSPNYVRYECDSCAHADAFQCSNFYGRCNFFVVQLDFILPLFSFQHLLQNACCFFVYVCVFVSAPLLWDKILNMVAISCNVYLL